MESKKDVKPGGKLSRSRTTRKRPPSTSTSGGQGWELSFEAIENNHPQEG